MTPIRETLTERFGFEAFRPGQEAVIEHLMAGRSAAAVFPTGSGKSLCFQLPALLLPGLTLVVSPLIALMKDQIDQLRSRGIAAERLDSTLSVDAYREVMAAARDGALRLLYVAPERFNNERFRASIERLPISLFAIDEAHCVSEWGHNFRPDYLKLAGFGQQCGAERILALTATATPQVLEDICRGFDIDANCAVRTGFYRPNLELLLTPTLAAERDQALAQRLQDRPPGPTIVYVTLQRTAEDVAARLRAADFDAHAYHAGMKDEVRATVQDTFIASQQAIVVATIAFGMGIDKANIRYVYHYNLPKSLENLSQEIGRAGRDGEPAICETLVSTADRAVLANFAYGDTPALNAIRTLLTDLAVEDDEFEVSLYTVARQHDIRPLVLRTLLTYLELDGYLQIRTPVYATYRFKALATSQEILGRFEGERRAFLAALFRQAKKGRVWLTLDLDAAAQRLQAPRERLMRALDYLGQQGLLVVESAGLRHRYRWLRRPEDGEALAVDLHQRSKYREQREVERLEQILELAVHDGCQTNFLSAYFGEEREEPCGHCSWCHNNAAATLQAEPAVTIDEARFNQAAALRQDNEALAESRAFTRFLAGLTSPGLTAARLGKHPLFGSQADVPFADLLARALEVNAPQ